MIDTQTPTTGLVRLEDARTTPYHCPLCKGGDWYGVLRFEGGRVPQCPNHETPVDLVPSRG